MSISHFDCALSIAWSLVNTENFIWSSNNQRGRSRSVFLISRYHLRTTMEPCTPQQKLNAARWRQAATETETWTQTKTQEEDTMPQAPRGQQWWTLEAPNEQISWKHKSWYSNKLKAERDFSETQYNQLDLDWMWLNFTSEPVAVLCVVGR